MSSLKKKFLQGAWAALLTYCLVLYMAAILSITILIYSNLSQILGISKTSALPLLLMWALITLGSGVASSFISFIVLGFFWQMPIEESKLYLKRLIRFGSDALKPLS